MKIIKTSVLLVLTLGVMLLLPKAAAAHATPTESFPNQGQILSESPDQVRITYSERVEENVSIIRVFDQDGQRVDQKNSQVDSQNPRSFVVDLASELAPGTYTAAWQLVSADDGHFSKGAFTFGVGDSEITSLDVISQLQILHLTTLPEVITIFIELVGQSLLVAVFAMTGLVYIKKKSFAVSLQKTLFPALILGSLLIITGSLSHILLKSFDLQQLLVIDFQMTLKQYLTTNVGLFTAVRLMLAISILILAPWHSNKKVAWVQLSFLTGILASRSYISHAAASLLWPEFSVLLTFIHLIFKELWIGTILLMMLSKLWPQKILSKAQTFLFNQTNKLTAVALIIGGITGSYIVWLDLKSFSNLFTTEWGTRLLLVLLLAGWLVLFRSFGWFLKKIFLTAESLVALSVLFVTSYLVITSPPLLIDSYQYHQLQTDQETSLSLQQNPNHQEQLLFSANQPLEKVSFQLNQVDQNIGPLVVNPTQLATQKYALDTSKLVPPGKWQITVTANSLDGKNLEFIFDLNFPDEIQTTKINPSHRNLDLLAIVSLAGSGLLLLAGLFVLYQTKNSSYQEEPLSDIAQVILFGIILIFSWLGHQSVLRSDFEKQCLEDQNFWIQSTPLYNGKVVSANTSTGCTLDVGLYHFAEFDEYQYFNQLKPVSATLDFPDLVSAGELTTFSLQLTDDQQQPVTDVTIEHDRRVHLVIIGQDLETFAHIHTEDHPNFSPEFTEKGIYPFAFSFPRPGKYTLLADYAVNGQEFSDQFYVQIEGESENTLVTPTSLPFAKQQTINNYRIELETPPKLIARKNQYLTYTFFEEDKPVTNIQPYLAASMHLAVLKQDMQTSFHTHGEIWPLGSSYFQGLLKSYISFHSHFVPNFFGPTIHVPVQFPEPGTYIIFSQIQHQGEVLLSRFAVEVQVE